MKPYTRIPRIRVFNAPLSVHWSVFVIAGLLLLKSLHDPLLACLSIASYLGIILLHEAGHAYVAKRLRLRRYAIRISAVHGVCEFEEPESAKQDYLVAWGGVLAQLAVALPLIAFDLGFGIGRIELLRPVVGILGYVSVAIAAFNLIPAPGLDGAKAWRLIPLLLEERRERIFRPSRKRSRFRLIK
jgi:Zn-dependent protease